MRNQLARTFLLALLLIYASSTWSESAPVYDVDAMEQSDDSPQRDNQDFSNTQEPSEQQAQQVQSREGYTNTNQDFVERNDPGVNDDQTAIPLNQRLARLEQQVSTIQDAGLLAHLDSLQTQIQTLRNEVEQLTHQLEQSQSEQKERYLALEKRLQDAQTKNLSAGSLSPSLEKSVQKTADKTSIPTKSVDQPNVAEEQQIYQTAYRLIKTKKYDEAISALQSMLKKYPTGQFAANAHYWLGELYGVTNRKDQSLLEFSTVISSYPDNPRVADAQLKVGLLLSAQSKWREAKTAFKKVINHHPGTTSARLAAEQLKQIKSEGH